MSEKGCNGFANYETWATALWLGNEMSSYAHWKGQAMECWEEAGKSRRVKSGSFTQRDQAALLLADRLSDVIKGAQPVKRACLYADLMQAALSDIDWYEIAEHLLTDIGERDAQGRSQSNGGQPHE